MTSDVPRYPVPIWKLFLRMGGWWVLGIGLVLLMLTLLSTLSLSLAQKFEAEGREARAQVTARYTTESRDSDGDTTTTYWLTLEYVTDKGEQIKKNESVGTGTYRSVAKGDMITLLYLESAPETVEINRGSNRRFSRVTQIIALLIGLGWLALFWRVGDWTVAAVRARRYGARQIAVVTQIKPTHFRVNGRSRHRLLWKDRAGIKGQSLMQKQSRIEGLKPGDQIEIYKGLKRSWWVGDVGERPEYAQESNQ